jgi:hypothetical protein
MSPALAGVMLAQAPASRFTLLGQVLDPTDAAVAGAQVVLQHNDGSAPVTVRADGTGAFRFIGVSPGSYKLSVEHEGFKPATSQVRIGSRPPALLVIRLRVAGLR